MRPSCLAPNGAVDNFSFTQIISRRSVFPIKAPLLPRHFNKALRRATEMFVFSIDDL